MPYNQMMRAAIKRRLKKRRLKKRARSGPTRYQAKERKEVMSKPYLKGPANTHVEYDSKGKGRGYTTPMYRPKRVIRKKRKIRSRAAPLLEYNPKKTMKQKPILTRSSMKRRMQRYA